MTAYPFGFASFTRSWLLLAALCLSQACDGDTFYFVIDSGQDGAPTAKDSSTTDDASKDGRVSNDSGMADGNSGDDAGTDDGGMNDAGKAPCEDGIRGQSETDVDFGGGECERCEGGKTCLEASDCNSAMCVEGTCVTLTCPDGTVDDDEECDDDNMVDGDGCDTNCRATACGNNVVTDGEACDDGNLTDGDGCDSNCTATACGNGVQSNGEACDDGNLTDGDGCDSNCAVTACGNGVQTAGEACDDGNLTDGDGCDSNCTATACGNGIQTAGEACDDGNLVDDDGCDSNCTVTACGNDVLTFGEVCDDGNLTDGDGCDSNCTATACGNGIQTTGEACDDGNLTDGDGCDSNCTATACGNGIQTAGEECDDGNSTMADGCENNCKASTCRPGVPAGTPCADDGNPCTVDQCDGGTTCTHTTAPAGTVCRASEGFCDSAEICVGNVCPADTKVSAGTVCRAAITETDGQTCDVAEACDGVNNDCPANDFKASGTVCRAAASFCDAADTCSGSNARCINNVKPPTTECRAATGLCDSPEYCNAGTCPADTVKAAGAECRAAAGLCDVAEVCNGSSKSCPADARRPDIWQCRAPTNECDLPEYCLDSPDGVNCPADGAQPDSTICAGAGDCERPYRCESGVCTEQGARIPFFPCRGAAYVCDQIERCGSSTREGWPNCPEDFDLPDATQCIEKDTQGQCVRGGCTPVKCRFTVDCLDGFSCVNEACVRDTSGFGAACTGGGPGNQGGSCGSGVGLSCCAGMEGDGSGGIAGVGVAGRCMECCNTNDFCDPNNADYCCDGKCIGNADNDTEHCGGCGLNSGWPQGSYCPGLENACTSGAFCEFGECNFKSYACNNTSTCTMPLEPTCLNRTLYTELLAPVAPADTVITVRTTLGFPPSGKLQILDFSGNTQEIIVYESKEATFFRVSQRGSDGTVAGAHAILSRVEPYYSNSLFAFCPYASSCLGPKTPDCSPICTDLGLDIASCDNQPCSDNDDCCDDQPNCRSSSVDCTYTFCSFEKTCQE